MWINSLLTCAFILVPRAHDPSGLRQGSRALAGSKTVSQWITDFRRSNDYKNAYSLRLRIFRNWPELSIPTEGQKDRGHWGREWRALLSCDAYVHAQAGTEISPTSSLQIIIVCIFIKQICAKCKSYTNWLSGGMILHLRYVDTMPRIVACQAHSESSCNAWYVISNAIYFDQTRFAKAKTCKIMKDLLRDVSRVKQSFDKVGSIE